MRTFTFVRLALLCLSLNLPAFAEPTATILGRVIDPSGAVVAGATVTAHNESTGIERSTVTTATGDFELSLLPITGKYTLTVSMTGFQSEKIAGIELEVDQRARFDVSLKVGSVSENISVQAETPVVNTDTGSIGQVIQNRTILDLPLNGRDFTALAALTPGAQSGGNNSNTGFPTIIVGGGHAAKTEILLDGISDQDQLYDGVEFTPSVDAIQEFKVQANSFSAEYGRGDAIINATIKGGTNEFHGDLFEFLRNSALDARNFFNTGAKAQLEQNQFGGTVGGPIKRNRTFFFASYDGTRVRQGQSKNNLVPTQAERAGDLTGLGVSVNNPVTGVPYPNNTIPSSDINPVTTYFLQFVPLPNTAQGTYYFNAPFTSNVDQGNIRIDHRFNDADSLFGRYSINDLSQFNPGNYPVNGGSTRSIRVQNVVVDETHIFTPTLVNDLRLGYLRMYSTILPQGLGTNYTVQSGIQGFQETTANFPGFPNLSVGGFETLISGNDFQPLVNPENMYEIVDSITWTKGAHTIRIGADLRRDFFTSTNAAHSRGDFNFSGQYTGAGFGDFLTGYPLSGSRDFPRNIFGETVNNYHFYVQDDWKVNGRLTLNLGLRYEFNPQPAYFQNQASWFDPITGQIAVSEYHGAPNLVTQQVAKYAYPQFQQYFVTPKEAGLPNNLLFNQYNNWAPRLGFAFRPSNDNKTVVRGGAGIFYLLQSGNNTVSQPILNLPFIVDESKSQPTVNGVPTQQAQNFFEPFSTNSQFNTPLAFSFDPHNRTPLLYEWNFAVQRQLMPDMALEVAYVGSKGTYLEQMVPFNIPAVNPNDNRPIQERLPFPAFAEAGTYLSNQNNSNYHALQVKLEKRFSKGLSFLASYVHGKAIDATTNDQGGESFTGDPLNLRSMRGPSNFDVEDRLVLSYGYELPFGRGRAFMSSAPLIVDAVLGGWQVAGITTFQSGTPFTPVLGSGDPAHVNRDYATRPNAIGSPDLAHPGIDDWFNLAAFAEPAPYTIGNAGRNSVRGPGLQNWDISILKNFHFTERWYLQFRSEFFNAFNHANFSNPNANTDDPVHGGQITSTSTDARIIQFGLKLYF
jgi:hypothetical protein